MRLKRPFEISARLLPAVRIGDSWLSMDNTKTVRTKDRRLRHTFFLDGPAFGSKGYRDDQLRSGVGQLMTAQHIVESFKSFVSFLANAAEIHRGRMRRRERLSTTTDDCSFPPRVMAWCYQNEDVLQQLEMELEAGVGLLMLPP